MIEARKPAMAFTLGGMGSAKTNFYNDAFKRAGYVDAAEEVQGLWVSGKKEDGEYVARILLVKTVRAGPM